MFAYCLPRLVPLAQLKGDLMRAAGTAEETFRIVRKTAKGLRGPVVQLRLSLVPRCEQGIHWV